ncbi:bifunctional diguanylate cyclase/phosphodiesterase [Clostridium cylindrosporum]|uniref:Diguanylate cyclase n=1 Tax=Clostridium cylindrosporum DSM 605 TaxID=1121307 RepID=A0A0J8D7F5_CLOCY|nr:bifunctional diguanylate cyclase/phosphodiesterase [Clostridium cylindrosporum]KMT21827.1 diguanylate cyclase [Clostridium cylindrosporum DSM 605]
MTSIYNNSLKKDNKNNDLIYPKDNPQENFNLSKEEMEKKIEFISNHDYLTKLPHRAFFRKQIKLQCEEFREKERSFALMMLNVDGFKYINDALGYSIGDNLLVEIAYRLKMFLGEDIFISRYFGDQFAIIVPGLGNIGEYEWVAKKVIDLFSNPFIINQHNLNITVSMGVSIFPEDGKDHESLKNYANRALIRAKTEAKNSYKFYSPKMNIQSYKQFILRNDFLKAIKNGEFKVYYQPIIKLKNNEILAAEALIRWDHPTWGLVFPSEFISIADETGFIIDMGNWLLRDICDTYRKWIDSGLPAIKISINYSSIHLQQKNFLENVKNIIDEFKLNPNFLIIEIIESILFENKEEIMHNIKCLRAYGIQVALNNFGRSYSSLQYLNSLNIDILKIDSSFIKNVTIDKTSDIIIESLIKMAQELKVKLVAEGIETDEQLHYLKKLNCHTGQGYLYIEPTPIQEFEKILSKKKLNPINVKNPAIEGRRNFFRINFINLLEVDMTVLTINDKKVNLGYTKALIKDMGPGGLRFISTIRLPIKNNIILQFKTEILAEEINVYGCPKWIEEVHGDLYEYGIEFTVDENERTILTGVLHKFEVKMKNNMGFNEGRFVFDSPNTYFPKLS